MAFSLMTGVEWTARVLKINFAGQPVDALLVIMLLLSCPGALAGAEPSSAQYQICHDVKLEPCSRCTLEEPWRARPLGLRGCRRSMMRRRASL